MSRALAAFLALMCAVCSARGQRADAHAHADELLRVLVWNIQRGANNFDDGPEKALRVIREVAPDLCLLQESYDVDGPRPQLGLWLAEQLGWNAHQGQSPHLCVLTRLEIIERFEHEPWHAVGARLRDAAGREVVAYTIWIDSNAYTPYALRDNPALTDAELIAHEAERSGRLAQATGILAHLQAEGHMRDSTPLLVGGDWNCPSHLDWTPTTQLVFRHRRALALPVSIAMVDAGFRDAFRVVHPEPVQSPGITWSPLYLGTSEAPETADRIDRLYLSSSAMDRLEPTRATVLPEVWEDPSIPAARRAFPSDHGAVVIDLRWRPTPGAP